MVCWLHTVELPLATSCQDLTEQHKRDIVQHLEEAVEKAVEKESDLFLDFCYFK